MVKALVRLAPQGEAPYEYQVRAAAAVQIPLLGQLKTPSLPDDLCSDFFPSLLKSLSKFQGFLGNWKQLLSTEKSWISHVPRSLLSQGDQNTPNGYALRLSPSRDNVLSLVHGSQGENFRPSQRAICLRRASLFFTSTKSNSLVEDVSRPLLALECDNYFRNTVSFLSSV